MSFPKYDRYKDSGVEWLGEVPEHWNTLPVKHIIDQIESGTSVNASDEPAVEGELGVLKTSCVYSGQFDSSQNKTVIASEIARVTCPLKINTLIVSRMNTPELVGATGLVKSGAENIYLPDRLWQVSFSSAEPNFVYYWSQSSLYRGLIKATCSGTSSSMQNLGQDQFRSFYIPLPPLPEQRSIATFLDRETTKIDELIAEQQRLIDLLKEKRQAVISHAVTKGLNPDAPMKDSAIEWLGEVPEGWDVVHLRRAISASDYGISDSLDSVGEIPVLRMGNILSGNIVLDDLKYIDKVDEELLLTSGDVLFNRTNSLDLIGKVGVFRSEQFDRITFASYLVRLRFRSVDVPEYMSYLLNTNAVLGEARSYALVSIGQCNLNPTRYAYIRISLPPPEEQQEIVNFLDRATTEIDELIAEAQHAIALLQERRTALISAAVTGKIDVRSLV